jgi:hypothetical protein
MIWQDLVIAIGQWFFAITLLPTLFSKELPPYFTSIPTGMILIIFGFTFGTLSLWNSAISSIVVGCVWLSIAIKKYWTREN